MPAAGKPDTDAKDAPDEADKGSAHVDIVNVSKRYGASTILSGINLRIPKGELVTLLGPSGCGKTTLLRLIAGLATPNEGRIAIARRDVTMVPPHKRNVGVVFQNYALFPHLTVAGNVGFGLAVRRLGATEIAAKVGRALGLVKLGHLAARPISALSGGQQQRVALARALAVEPDVVLFDEALSALDRSLRETMQVELRSLLKDIGATALFVTHDQDEALTMSDMVAVMNGGRIEHCSDPQTVYTRPETLFSMRFIGLSTEVRGKVDEQSEGKVRVATGIGPIMARGAFWPGSPVVVATRPEHLALTAPGDAPPAACENSVHGLVRDIIFHGARRRVGIEAPGGLLLSIDVSGGATVPAPGQPVQVHWSVEHSFAYPEPAVAA